MTVFAGAVALDGQSSVDERTRSELSAALSRHPGDDPTRFVGATFFLCYLNLGAIPGSGELVDENGSISLLCGDPHLNGLAGADRSDDLALIHRALLTGDEAPLRDARGSYCLAQFDHVARRLRLVTDHLGVRPIYWAHHNGVLYFASALRILEAISALPRTLDLRGVGEISAFGFPLAERSPYQEIKTLPPAGLVETSTTGKVTKRAYFDWNRLEDSGLRGDALVRALYAEFERAVQLRLRGCKRALAFFSGGLDSRCIVALLRAAGTEVHTVNFAPRGSLDLELGQIASQRLGTVHFERPTGLESGYARLAAAHNAWMEHLGRDKLPEFPHAAWTGGGGSVGMGHVYFTPRIIELITSGRLDESIHEYLRSQKIAISARLFRARYRAEVESLCHRGVREELETWRSFDEARRFHLFLMFNDQRRHEAPLYEDIDLLRVDFISPFFDAAFVKLILSTPAQPFLRHQLYYDWLKLFPFALDSFPWQAYPGHVPCPLPMPAGLRDQWKGWHSQEEARQMQNRALAHYRADLSNSRFPGSLMRRSIAFPAWWLTRTRLRDSSWMLKTVNVFAAYNAKANGSGTVHQ